MRFKTLAFALLVAAGPSTFAEGAAPLAPLVVDGERYFTLEWQAADTQVWGRIRNEWGFAARKVRLLVDSLDAAGAVTAQTIAYVPFDLTPGSGSYFAAHVPRAAAYRVSVYQWEWIQSGGGDTVR
jgi:hypothetical protein